MITTVGPAHLRHLMTLTASPAKSRDHRRLVSGGVAVLNADTKPVKFCKDTPQNALLFGQMSHLGIKTWHWRKAGAGRHAQWPAVFQTVNGGRHFAMNGLAFWRPAPPLARTTFRPRWTLAMGTTQARHP
jgi:UDP-N-acetylmuramyl pentapeptide synthase